MFVVVIYGTNKPIFAHLHCCFKRQVLLAHRSVDTFALFITYLHFNKLLHPSEAHLSGLPVVNLTKAPKTEVKLD